MQPVQQGVGVEQRHLQEKYVQERSLYLFLSLLAVTLEKFRTVIGPHVHEHVRLVQLGKHLDDLALAGHFALAVLEH